MKAFLNRPENRGTTSLNPQTWDQVKKEDIYSEVGRTPEGRLHAVEHAIQLLDMHHRGVHVDADEERTCLRDLRAARVEMLKG